MDETKNIIIASVLKPADEPRMYRKLGLSLREKNKYRPYILGFTPKKQSIFEGVTLLSIFNSHRLSPSRVLAGIRLIRHILIIRPEIVIVTTYELLPAACLAKKLRPFMLIYDVQENYSLNIRSNSTLPRIIRSPIAKAVQWIERVTNKYVDQHMLAEQCYLYELPNLKHPLVIENKYAGAANKLEHVCLTPISELKFLIVGTLAEVYGTHLAMEWFLAALQHNPNLTLTVTGHCPLDKYRRRLEALAMKSSRITLVASQTPVANERINIDIANGHVWMMPYQLVSSIQNKIPTKLYEALALQKPVLITANPKWTSIIDRYKAGLAIDFGDFANINTILDTLREAVFYIQTPGEEVLWTGEKRKVLEAINKHCQNGK